MKITPETQTVLDGFRCVRLTRENASLLAQVQSPVIQGCQPGILGCFCSEATLQANDEQALASYLVTYQEEPRMEEVVCLFFSLRCGELYNKQNYTSEQIQIALKAYPSLLALMYDENLDEREKAQYANMLILAERAGIELEDIKKIYRMKQDAQIEKEQDIHRVSQVFSGIELKLFGVNANARKLWEHLKIGRSMGETLFWQFVIPKLKEIAALVGVEYLYLFAADNSPDRRLVRYYQNRLHFNCEKQLATNKPNFDFQCRFLYQSVQELFRQRDCFFDHFVEADPV